MKIAIFIIMTLALLVCVLTVVVTVYQLIRRKEYEKIRVLKEYKKGRFALIYLASLLIYYANSLYNSGFSFFENIVTAMKNTVTTVAFRVTYSDVQLLIESNKFYELVYFIFLGCLILSAILFLISLFLPRLIQGWKKQTFILSREKIIFFGFNKDVKIMVKSAKENKIESMVFADLKEKDLEFVIGNKVYYKNDTEESVHRIEYIIKSHLLMNKKAKINIIVNTLDDDRNLIITRKINKIISKYKDNLNLQAYVFGNGESQTAFIKYVEKSQGRINYLNKYQRVAVDFIDRYPLTAFMNDNHIDYEHALLKKDVNMNVYLVGYGKVNQEILSVSIANNQFAIKNCEKIEKKNVKYYIYDNKEIRSNKNINHYYKRFETELEEFYANKEDFLPLDIEPADIINSGKIDFDSLDFYVQLHKDIANTKKNDINYVIVSFGNDTENIDMAEKLVVKMHEWDVSDQTQVFVRVTNSKCVENISSIRKINLYDESDEIQEIKFGKERINLKKLIKFETKEDLYYTFGEEDRVLYDIKKIFNDQEMKIAKNRNAIYYSEKANVSNIDEEFINKAYSSWYDKSQIQRDSNYYAYLNIRTKLNLLGYDYIDNKLFNEKKHTKVDFSEFEKKYFKNSEVVNVASKTVCFGGDKYDICKYDFQFDPKDCVRTNIAMQEHLRWNAYTISMGVIPSSISEIISSTDDGRDYIIKRKHNCLTTFDGLKKLRSILAVKYFVKNLIIKNNPNIDDVSAKKLSCDLLMNDFEKYEKLFKSENKDEKYKEFFKNEDYVIELEELKKKCLLDADYINYDFEIMDSLKWLLDVSGYCLIKKKEN